MAGSAKKRFRRASRPAAFFVERREAEAIGNLVEVARRSPSGMSGLLMSFRSSGDRFVDLGELVDVFDERGERRRLDAEVEDGLRVASRDGFGAHERPPFAAALGSDRAGRPRPWIPTRSSARNVSANLS